ncbi:hypothetical protein ES703_110347 [subsurface metagenome]
MSDIRSLELLANLLQKLGQLSSVFQQFELDHETPQHHRKLGQEAHGHSYPIAVSAQYLIKNAIFLIFPLYSCMDFFDFWRFLKIQKADSA